MKCVKMVRCRADGVMKPCFFSVLPGPRFTFHGCQDSDACLSCAVCWHELKRSLASLPPPPPAVRNPRPRATP